MILAAPLKTLCSVLIGGVWYFEGTNTLSLLRVNLKDQPITRSQAKFDLITQI